VVIGARRVIQPFSGRRLQPPDRVVTVPAKGSLLPAFSVEARIPEPKAMILSFVECSERSKTFYTLCALAREDGHLPVDRPTRIGKIV
jgi:hypothetical protein